jgi:hypothetical protein
MFIYFILITPEKVKPEVVAKKKKVANGSDTEIKTVEEGPQCL